MDEVTLVRDVRQVEYVTLFDGTRNKPWGKQLCAEEWPRAIGLPDPHKRKATEMRQSFEANRSQPVWRAEMQVFAFDEGDAA